MSIKERLVLLVNEKNIPGIQQLLAEALPNKEYHLMHDYYIPAARAAIISNQPEVVKLFLDYGVNPNVGSSNRWSTLLVIAAQHQNHLIMDMLIARGALIQPVIYEEFNRREFPHLCKTLLDYSMGCDFDDLSFLRNLLEMDVCLIGVSVRGIPITLSMLQENNIPGAERCIITLNDLNNLADAARKERIRLGLDSAFVKSGRLIQKGEATLLEAFNSLLKTGQAQPQEIVNLVPLLYAVANHNLLEVRTRLSAGIDPLSQRTMKGEKACPLHLAAEKGYEDVIRALIPFYTRSQNPQAKVALANAFKAARDNKHFALGEFLESQQDVNTQNDNGETFLHRAVREADATRVRDLLSRGADVRKLTKQGLSALAYAARYASSEKDNYEQYLLIIRTLMTHRDIIIDNPVLKAAMEFGHQEALELLLPRADLSDLTLVKYSVMTNRQITMVTPWFAHLMLQATTRDNAIELLRTLQGFGADLRYLDTDGNSLLMHAVMQINRLNSHSASLIHFLLDNNVSPLVPSREGDGEYTPLHWLIAKTPVDIPSADYRDLLEKFVINGAVADVTACKGQYTILADAAKVGDTIAVDFLIHHKVSLNTQNGLGDTALHCAISHLCVEITDKLVSAGADLKIRNAKGLTHLELLDQTYAEQLTEIKDTYQRRMDHVNMMSSGRSFTSASDFQRQRDAHKETHDHDTAKITRKYTAIKSILNLAELTPPATAAADLPASSQRASCEDARNLSNSLRAAFFAPPSDGSNPEGSTPIFFEKKS